MTQARLGLSKGLKPDRRTLFADIVAGGTFALINVPQGMANAVLAGVNPVAGLYALMVAVPVGALFTSSVFMNVSTTGALSVAAGEALQPFQGAGLAGALVTLVLLVGAFQLVFGILRMGRLIRFVSNAVMTGFITGIAILIMLGSVPDMTGYASDQPNHVLRLADTILNRRSLDYQTVTIAAATVAMILGFQRTRGRKFALILALLAATVLALALEWVTGRETILRVGDVASIPRSLPKLILPDLGALLDLLLPALAIAIIGLIQGAGVGQSYPNPDGSFPDTSRDFLGQGAANLASGAFGGIPCGGSMSGTAVTVQAGAKSRWANIFAGVFVVLIVLLLVDLVVLVPMPALGGLLLVVGYQNIQPENVRTVWYTGLSARAAMVATLVATIFLPLQYAILLGVALSFMLHVTKVSNRIEIREIAIVEGGFPVEKAAPAAIEANQILVLRIRGALFFASAEVLETQLPHVTGARGATLILLVREIDDLGSTAIRLLQRYALALRAVGGTLVLAGVSESLRGQFDRTGLTGVIGERNLYAEHPEIGAALNEALADARTRLLA